MREKQGKKWQIELQNEEKERLDICLNNLVPEFSRQQIKTFILQKNILLNKKPIKPKKIVKKGDIIDISIPKIKEGEIKAKNIPLKILYEDESLIVINKNSGILSHPTPGNTESTLVNALLYHCGASLSGIGGIERPGIVHRLDKETSGCMVIAKDDITHRDLSKQFAERSVNKFYIAIGRGKPQKQKNVVFTHIHRHPTHRLKMICTHSGIGKPAITRYKLLEINEEKNLSLFLCKPLTGRTHQIRVHLFHQGCPLLGDPLYNPKNRNNFQINRLMLHSIKLHFIHPKTRKKMHFFSKIPNEFSLLFPLLLPYSDFE